jgi:hypothetical protein
MASTFMKPRSIPQSNRSFGDSMKRGRQLAERGGQFKRIEGEFNDWYPKREKALWFAICPTQAWNSEVWDRELGEVEKLENEYYYVYTNHRIAATKRNFTCSAGAHKDKPCWGCGIRNAFYDAKREKKEAMGIEEKGEAPISAMVQYAFAGVLLETIAKVKLMDNQGRPKTTARGEPIFREVPTAMLPKEDADRYKAEGSTTFGLPVHYSVGKNHYNAIMAFDEEMRNRCANCAEELLCQHMACPECTTEHEVANDEGEPLKGQDLLEWRLMDLQCDCGYFGPMLPTVQCSCGEPQEGKLVDFALRLISEKTSDTATVLKYTGVRPLKRFIDKYPAVQAMLETPLKIDEIKAPTSLSKQISLIPQNLRGDGITPHPKRRDKDAGPQATPYPLAGGQAPSDDEDDDA